MRYRNLIVRSLQGLAGLTLALAVAAILWAGLAALGDRAGEAVARGAAWGLAVCWAANLVVLVVLVALAEVELSQGRLQPAEVTPPQPAEGRVEASGFRA
jgi:threonine/homoserine efflux transporter RhtA